MVKLTIVTICKDAEPTISNAIRSVYEQTFCDYEYIIIDGLSKDKTFDTVMEFKSKFTMKGIKTLFLSERDNGIWDAMNKAIKLAQGEWIYFLNADDKIHDIHVLDRIFGENGLESNNYDVIYGDTFRINRDKAFIGKAMPIDFMRLNMPFCHQGCFTKTSIMKKYMFDESFRVADYNFFLSLYLDGGKFLQIDLVVADYSETGFSNQNKYLTYLGTVDVRSAHNLVRKDTIKQKLKNIYFKELLIEDRPFHRVAGWIDKHFSRRKS